MIANHKFRRIARDLEKLPCELHEDILADLEFRQLIRLSSCAGPRLTWSLKRSPSPWSCHFRWKDMSQLQKLLAITDRLQRFCFRVSKKPSQPPRAFEYMELSFLSWKTSQWKMNQPTISLHAMHNGKPLARHWLETMNEVVFFSTSQAFREGHAYLVQPWAAEIPGAGKTIETIVHKFAGRMKIEPKQFFTVDELASFVELYQQARLKKAEAFSKELHHLAELYEKHPTRLKMPFDLRPFAPKDLNATHVPLVMRRQARRIMNIAQNTPWHVADMFMHRFAWPALIPYDWCAQLFNEIVLKPGFLERDTTNDPKAATMIQNCRDIFAKRPSWTLDVPEGAALEAKNDADASRKRGQQQQQLVSQGFLPHPIRICVSIKKKACSEEHVIPRGEEELQWLEKFAQVTAYLDEEYPKLAQE